MEMYDIFRSHRKCLEKCMMHKSSERYLILALDGCLEFYARKYFRVIKSYFGNGSA